MMAATTVKTTTISTLTAKPIINGKLKNSSELNHEAFDPIKHLNFVEEPSMLSLKDLSLPEDLGISPVAVSQPFPLFSEEAIRLMREEIFTNEVWDNCLHSTDFAQCQLRGHSPKYVVRFDISKSEFNSSKIADSKGIHLSCTKHGTTQTRYLSSRRLLKWI